MHLQCVPAETEGGGRPSRYAVMLHCPNCSGLAAQLAQAQLDLAAALERISAITGERDKAVLRLIDCLKELLTT